MKKLLFISIFTVFVFCNCTGIMLKMYGFKKTYTVVNNDNLATLAEKHEIPLSDWYELDSSYYSFIMSYDKDIYHSEMNNHLQTLQALYFDKNGDLVSYHINCYAGGFPNLKWNRHGTFDVFIPKLQAPLDSLVTRDKLLPYLNPSIYTEETTFSDYDYVVVVFWGDYLGRQSERFIKIVKQNIDLADKNQQIKVIYVNMDNFDYQLAQKHYNDEN